MASFGSVGLGLQEAMLAAPYADYMSSVQDGTATKVTVDRHERISDTELLSKNEVQAQHTETPNPEKP